MKFVETELPDALLIEDEPSLDDRGWFCRVFGRNEFLERGLDPTVAQTSISFNRLDGTLRGMHYQTEPHAESKLVRCIKGAIYDVIVDLRKSSRTFMRWSAFELNELKGSALYVPKFFAHGFLTLEDNTQVLYQISTEYEPFAAQGIRWNDPTIGIKWPSVPRVISDRDASFPDFTEKLLRSID